MKCMKGVSQYRMCTMHLGDNEHVDYLRHASSNPLSAQRINLWSETTIAQTVHRSMMQWTLYVYTPARTLARALIKVSFYVEFEFVILEIVTLLLV